MPEIILPTLHAAQADIFRQRTRLNAARCGRRFGKDILMITLAADAAAKGKRAGLFAPEHKQLSEPFDYLSDILGPIKTRSSRNEGTIRTSSGGVCDFWPLNDNDLAGRGREYDLVLINEAAFTKTPGMLSVWRKSIKPTLLTRKGTAWVFSTPNGIDQENFFYLCCNDPELGFKEFHAPTASNPFVPPEELEKERLGNHPLVFRQEFLAEFVSWAGEAFFSLDKMLVNGLPVEAPSKCDGVLAVIDTAAKTGKENDGTGVVYVAFAKVGLGDYKLVILDWDLIQIEGAMLETWLPTVLSNLESFAKKCGARNGSLGAFIEDAGPSGAVLIQQARRRNLLARPIESKLTSMGKDERALSVSGYFYRGEVKISRAAHEKVTTYKGVTRNHLESQLIGFRIADKDAAKRQDDVLDCTIYSAILCLGDSGGY